MLAAGHLAGLGLTADPVLAVEDPTTTTVPPIPDPTSAPVPAPTPDPDPTTTTEPALPSTPTTTTTIPTGSAAPTAPTVPDHPNGERSALDPEQTHAAQAEFAGLTEGQRGLLRQLQSARDSLATRRFALVSLAREVAVARNRLDEARAVEGQARARIEQIRQELERVKDEIARLAAAAYRNRTGTEVFGAVGTLDVDGASMLARAGTYAEADVAVLRIRVDSLTALERRLETNRRNAEIARVEAETSAADLDARLAAQTKAFEDASDAAAKTQAAVARSLGSDARLVAQMVDPHFGTDDISSVLGFVQAGQPDPLTLDGIFTLPLQGASLSSPYGLRIDPIGGAIGFHAGLDFGAEARTWIRAAGPGMVVVAGDCGGYGNCVVIDHGTSLATLYAHQSQVLVKVGDLVEVGQVIGLVGSTGISTGPHLHFEVRIHGRPIDPVPTLTT